MVSSLLALLSSLRYKLYIYGAAVIGFGLLILKAYLSGRRDGSLTIRREIDKRNERIQDEWKEIDRTPTDFDDAVSGLRKRSAKAGYKSSP